MKSGRVRIRIDRLVLPPNLTADGETIRASIGARIQASLSGRGGLVSSHVDSVDGGRVARGTATSVATRIGEVVTGQVRP
jgi:hypothetical protein